jgi:hypothetical protein
LEFDRQLVVGCSTSFFPFLKLAIKLLVGKSLSRTVLFIGDHWMRSLNTWTFLNHFQLAEMHRFLTALIASTVHVFHVTISRNKCHVFKPNTLLVAFLLLFHIDYSQSIRCNLHQINLGRLLATNDSCFCVGREWLGTLGSLRAPFFITPSSLSTPFGRDHCATEPARYRSFCAAQLTRCASDAFPPF